MMQTNKNFMQDLLKCLNRKYKIKAGHRPAFFMDKIYDNLFFADIKQNKKSILYQCKIVEL